MTNITNLPTVQALDTRYTQDVIPILDTSKFEHMQRVARVMAECQYIPEALRKGQPDQAMANCFLIVNQAVRWGIDPFALAQTAYVIGGKLAYEGKTIAAVINSDPRLKGRLDYQFSGQGSIRMVTVSGTFRDTGETKTIEGSVATWQTSNGQWKYDPDQMLVYRGSRQWARRWMPDRLLGVYSADELENIMARDVPTGQRAARMKDITPKQALPDIPDIPDEAPASDQTAEALEAVKTAINGDMLEHVRDEQFPDIDWSEETDLGKAYALKLEAFGAHK
jgi:hypothetical protein